MTGFPLLAGMGAGAPASAWQVAIRIETDNAGSAEAPQVGVDGNGNAVAVWSQWDGGRRNIWANRYSAGWGWGTATLIEIDDAGDNDSPQVAVDGSGNAVAVWSQWDGARYNIWANRYSAGWGWETATLIETDAGYAFDPQVAVDGSGNALAVWQQSGNIWANRYAARTGWGTAALIETDAGYADAPQVAVNSSGNAVAVWFQSNGTLWSVWANRYVAGSGWGTATLIETDNAGNAEFPQVGVDGNGNAVAVWSQWDGTLTSIWANRFVVGSGWGTATLIETNNAGEVYTPQVAVDRSGNAVAVWVQQDAGRDDIWANRYAAGSRWETATLIETDDVSHAGGPEVAVDGNGNAVAVWFQFDGTRNNILANRYAAGSGWGKATLIETDNAGAAIFPQVAVDGSGNALAVWQQSNGTRYNIWANRFVAVDATPPSIGIDTPYDGAVTNRSSVWVAGYAESGAVVSVNGYSATVGPNGSYGLLLALQPGPNAIVATARDAAGNSAPVTVTVTYTDPVPGLEQQLAGAQSNLSAARARSDALEASANATQAQLVAAQVELTTAQSRISALEGDANSTQSQLDAGHANLTAAQARVSTIEASAAATQAALALSQAREAALEANATAARQDLARAEARITTLETNGSTVPTPVDSGQAGLAMLLAAVGIGVGAVGCALAVRSKRPVILKETVASPPSPPMSPPPP